MRRSQHVIIHVLVALVLSLVINFSYLLVPIITEHGVNERTMHTEIDGAHTSGVLHIERDMHGYIVCDCEARDSVYVSAWQVRTFKLNDGDHIAFSTREPHILPEHVAMDMPHPRLEEVHTVNGARFDFDALYDRPSRTVEFVWQIVYYAAISLIMIFILAKGGMPERSRSWVVVRRMVLLLLITGVAIYFAPVMSFHDGQMKLDFFFRGDFRDNTYIIVLTKSLFSLVVTVLYARIYTLMLQQQTMVVENERLKTENLSTRYNMLVGQINPHFFFNSLNSLAMLVREGDQARSLEYIDQLSYTFRYIIQNGKSSTTTLKEELEFAEAYAYLFKIRYADKLFFDFEVEDKYKEWTIPALSLQPLIGNAVKHNSITTKNPLRVSIRVVDGVLEIENAKHPKLDTEPSTGIGLDNLRSRWQILTGKDIEIVDQAERFIVRLPLEKPIKA
ncbi:MAG: histidine kinase [Alistipes sp.]|nr:histidine kinase [Alistipes sp.]